MKLIIITILSSLLLISCTSTKEREQTTDSLSINSSDTISVPEVRKERPKSPWVIRLSEHWKDPKTYILAIPQEGDGLTFTSSMEPGTKPDYLYDTLQGKILKNFIKTDNINCDEPEYFYIELGAKKKQGWVSAVDVFVIDQLDLGTYTTGGNTFKLGAMKQVNRRDALGDCYPTRLIFLYDDAYLYLIDVTGISPDESSLRYINDKYLYLIDSPPGIGITGKTVDDLFVMDWGVPNASVTLKVRYTGDHIVYNYYEMRGGESDVDDLGDEEDK